MLADIGIACSVDMAPSKSNTDQVEDLPRLSKTYGTALVLGQEE